MPSPLISDALRDRVVNELLESFKDLPGFDRAKPIGYLPMYDADGKLRSFSKEIFA
jgi:hypothetical protein